MSSSPSSPLFTPISLGPCTLPNRIVISPMCQYSAVDGNATDWHMAHLGSLAMSGAGLLILEATAVNPEGRITPGDLGLYNDANEAALGRVVQALRAVSHMPLGIQLAHAGRKASSRAPWEGGRQIPIANGGWLSHAPSAVAHAEGEEAPAAMTEADIARVTAEFAATAKRAKKLGFQLIELHMAHGYLLHQFLSPLANKRTDQWGGSLDNRMRFPLAVFEAVREAVGNDVAVGVRVSGTDWVEGGWDIEQTIVLAKRLEAMGCQFIDVSSGGVSPLQKITLGPGYQVHLAEAVKKAVRMPVIAVGLINEPAQAHAIVEEGRADMVALARGMLFDPRWPWRAAAQLNGAVEGPKQYWRSLPPGSPRVFGDITIGQR